MYMVELGFAFVAQVMADTHCIFNIYVLLLLPKLVIVLFLLQ